MRFFKTLNTLLCILMITSVASAQVTLIPDSNFEQALIDFNYDTGSPDGSVPTANIEGVSYLSVSNFNISSMVGLEDFTALTYLNCSYTNLTNLDVSQNVALTYLNCDDCNLTSIDVSGAINLTDFYGRNNQLTTLDLSQNTALTFINCDNSNLTNLDLTQNVSLISLYCYGNQLTSLDISQNTALSVISCSYNNFTDLDISQNTSLVYLNCTYTQITNLDASQNNSLIVLKCNNNELTCLNLKSGSNSTLNSQDFEAHSNPDLSCIQVDDAVYSSNNWVFVDSGVSYSINCDYSNCGEVGANEITSSDIPHIYPTITSSSITLSNLTPNDEIIIHNLMGQCVYSAKASSIDLSINLKRFGNAGIYFVSVNKYRLNERVLLIN